MRAGNADGFSLIEMLVVLAIVALTLAVIAGSPFGHPRAPTPAALARQIAVAAASLEAKAVAHAKSQRIVVDIVAKQVTLGNVHFDVPPGVAISLKTGAELIEQGARGSIEFFPDGTSSGGEISLRDQTGRTASVRINWVTGAIKLGDGL